MKHYKWIILLAILLTTLLAHCIVVNRAKGEGRDIFELCIHTDPAKMKCEHVLWCYNECQYHVYEFHARQCRDKFAPYVKRCLGVHECGYRGV